MSSVFDFELFEDGLYQSDPKGPRMTGRYKREKAIEGLDLTFQTRSLVGIDASHY